MEGPIREGCDRIEPDRASVMDLSM